MVLYRRNLVQGGKYFFTVTLKNRKSKILIEHFELLKEAIRYTKKKYPFTILAWVILPDHLHMIWQLPSNDCNYSLRWKEIKIAFTKNLVKSGFSLKKNKNGEYDLWQRRFWEHTICNERDLENHINYIHYNPIKHKLVEHLNEWPFSSFHNYVKTKILPANWAGTPQNANSSYNTYGE